MDLLEGEGFETTAEETRQLAVSPLAKKMSTLASVGLAWTPEMTCSYGPPREELTPVDLPLFPWMDAERLSVSPIVLLRSQAGN